MASIAMTVGLMISIMTMLDSMDYLFDKAFGDALSYDYKVAFTGNVHRDVVKNLGEFKEITYVEPMAEYPVRLMNGWRKENTMVTGLVQGSRVYKLFDMKGNRVEVPREGILLTEGLAKSLGVKRGDNITIEALNKPGIERRIAVKGIVEQYLGGSAFMEVGALDAVLGKALQ